MSDPRKPTIKLTVQDFKDFVNKQDPERIVDHSLGWRECAVGDYMRDAGVTSGEMFDITWTFSRALEDTDPSLYSVLSTWHTHAHSDDQEYGNTYGHIQRWLINNA